MFKNEETFYNAQKKNETDKMNKMYDEAVKSVLRELGKDYPIIINGKEIFCHDKFEDRSPGNISLVLGTFQKASKKDVLEAINAAKKAFDTWKFRDYKDRAGIFLKAADIMSSKKYEFAALMSLENGKNRLEAIADVDEAIDFMRYYSEELLKNKGYIVKTPGAFSNEDTKSILKPYGVWGVIAPFNFPMAITTGMTTGALITGNTAILKPASDTPLMAYLLFKTLEEAGLPEGVLNYVTGSGEVVGDELITNTDVSGIVFTGSKAVGFEGMKKATAVKTKVYIAEMGSKNPIIVTKNANIDKAVEGVYKSAFGYDGQKCSACSRLYVAREVKKEFMEKLVAKAKQLKIGDPTDRTTYLGPVINKKAYEDFKKYVELAKKDGSIITGGKVCTEGICKDGYYVEPTIIDNLPKDHYLFMNELFLPILVVAEVSDLKEAIEEANKVDYGLTAGIFTESEEEIQYFFDHIDSGVLYANRVAGGSTGAMVGAQPFVGWKMSGTTGKGTGGPYYLQQFMREQSQTIAH
ncbi:MAG: aldehyde dehydrogenase family protein [Thermoplasmata archaeon]